MGYFSTLFKHTKGLNRIANAVGNVKIMLDNIENAPCPSLEDYLVVAWVCRVGIMDVIEAESMRMAYTLYVKINGHNTKMTIQEAYMMSVGRLSVKAGQLSETYNEAIQSVLDRGDWFDKVDEAIPADKRAIIMC